MEEESSQSAIRPRTTLFNVLLILFAHCSLVSSFQFERSTQGIPPSFVAVSMVEGRRQKKNKYGDFSKTDNLFQDPLEAMISDSEEKNTQIEKERTRKPNQSMVKVDATDEKRTRNEILFPDTKTIDPYDPSTYGYAELGTIIGAHGVKGEIKLMSVTDFPERLCRKGVRHLKAPNKRAPRKVQLLGGRHRMDREFLILLEGIGDRDEANKLRGCVLYAREEERPESIEDDEYMINDLIGLDVLIEEGFSDVDGADLGGRFVGTVVGIVFASEMCAIPGLGNDLLEISLPKVPGGTASRNDELVLIPFVPSIVPRVEINQNSILITPPGGLLDLKYIREQKFRIRGFLPPARS